MVVLEVQSGQVDMKDVRVALISSQLDVQYQLQAATCRSHSECFPDRWRVIDVEDINASRDDISIESASAGQTVKIVIVIPYSGNSASEWAKVRNILSTAAAYISHELSCNTTLHPTRSE